MNRMRIGMLGAVLAVSLGVSPAVVRALDQNSHRVDDRVQHLTKALALTDSQATQVRAILEKDQADKQQLMDAAEKQRDAAKQAFREHQEKTQQQISAVLTPEQQKKYTDLIAKRKERMQEREKHRGGWKSHEGGEQAAP